VRQFVDALKTSIYNGHAYRGLRGTNCDGATSLDNLESLLRAPDSSSRNPSVSHGKEMPVDVSECFHVTWRVLKDIGSVLSSLCH
jgi:hypothetical protein